MASGKRVLIEEPAIWVLIYWMQRSLLLPLHFNYVHSFGQCVPVPWYGTFNFENVFHVKSYFRIRLFWSLFPAVAIQNLIKFWHHILRQKSLWRQPISLSLSSWKQKSRCCKRKETSESRRSPSPRKKCGGCGHLCTSCFAIFHFLSQALWQRTKRLFWQ